ncbi:MAG: hypothetical protein LBU65_04305, partial [Planctomycetaceae bacterium]|nr:hypothetical protein [Planctomycetaceae bacterium]
MNDRLWFSFFGLTLHCHNPEINFVLPTIYFPSAAAPFAVMLMVGIVLRIVSRLVLLSTRHRSQCLFSETAWLPRDRYAVRKDGEDVLMLTNNGQYLLGSFFRHTSENYRGVVLFCHELNGNRYGVSP